MPILRQLPGWDSTANTTTSTLGANGVFTGLFEEVSGYAMISVTISSDQISAVDGIEFHWSGDGLTTDQADFSALTELTGANRAFSLACTGRWFRIVYRNGAVTQTNFRLTTTFHEAGSGQRFRSLKSTLTDDNFASMTRAVITARNSSGLYTSVGNSNPLPISNNGTNNISLIPISGTDSGSGNNTIITPTLGKKLRISYLSYGAAVAVTCAFRFGASGPLFLRNAISNGG